MKPGLYIVGTPIGNLGDITYRAVETLKGCDLCLAEDTRHVRKLLTRYEIRVRTMSCHKFNEASRIPAVLDRIRGGARVALTVNAGMPGISDPGARMVRACREAGLYVTAAPGPSSVSAAMALSGAGLGGGYRFEGFPPPKEGAFRRRMTELEGEKLPVVFLISPHKLSKQLAWFDACLGNRSLVLVKEITKTHERVWRGTAAGILASLEPASAHKGEFVLIVESAGTGSASAIHSGGD